MVRDLVGGGGRVKFAFMFDWDCLVVEEVPLACLGAIAGGPRLNVLSVAESEEPSLPRISVEATGVGGRLARGMVGCRGGSERHV